MFLEPWEHEECDLTVQIMSHMLFFCLIIPGALSCGLLPRQCLPALDNTFLTDHTHLPEASSADILGLLEHNWQKNPHLPQADKQY